MGSTQTDCAVLINGQQLTGNDVHDVLVEADLDQPDHAVVTLSNQSTKYSEKINEGDDIEVKLGFASSGTAQDSVFKGEIVGIEPVYAAAAPARVHIRSYNKLHLLMRGKKSATYTKVSDKDIVDKLCHLHNLSADFGSSPPTTVYDHVYQHNLTDLEFIRMRAARLGFEVSVDDKKLYFRKRVDADSGIKLVFGVTSDDSTSTLERFMPRLSTAQQVSGVKVYGWDPAKKEQIVGEAKPESSKLGDKHGSAVADGKHSNVLQVVHERPVASKEEADNIAKSILNDRMMDFITGDGVCRGNPKLKPGIIVTINVQDQRFDGKYHLVSVRHRYTHAGQGGGYRTEFKFRRDAKSGS
ncbi:MAG TPA: contractile injection system protein, VgrG/Pvc8 family [Polyangia bacterium]|nr:contractile injection system protein, VgrG/Pvc8 family [Polyangia bacterium]